MLILVAVVVNTAVNSGLFGHAKNATTQWADAQNKESELGNNIGDIVYKYTPGNVDWEEVIKNAEKHPDQSAENNDIGIGTDGKPVNLDLWRYTLLVDQTYRLCGSLYSRYDYAAESGYIGTFTESGEIIGTVPQFIVNSETGIALPVTDMTSTFYKCKNLVKAPVIPETITKLNHTFYYCESLTSINIPNSVISIGDHTFFGCTSLTSINIPNSITSIGGYAFSNCRSLTSINIPSSVASMGESVFYSWTEFQTINCQATEKPNGWNNSWDEYAYNDTQCKATVNWGVSM